MLSAYVINLDRSPVRLEKFNQHPDSIYFTRFPAVDKAWFAHIPHAESLLFDNTYLAQKYSRTNITLGEICCTLSHIGCWKKIAEDYSLADQQYAVIAEDDVVLTPNFAQQVVKLAKSMENSQSNIILLQKLGCRIDYWKTAISDGIREIQPIIFNQEYEYDNDGASLYLIRKSFAKEMTEKMKTIKPYWLADNFTAFCPWQNITVANPLLGKISDNNESYIWDRNLPAANTQKPIKKQKILFVHLSLIIGGSETILLNYLKMLAANPLYEVELLLLEEPRANKELLPENVKLSYILSDIESEFKIFLYWELLQGKLSEGQRYYFGSWDRGIKERLNNRLFKFFQENHFDLVINFNEHLDSYLEKYDLASPVIRWVHIKADLDKYQNNANYYKPILAKHQAIITISNEMDLLAKEMLKKLDLTIPTTMIYNPLDIVKIRSLMNEPEERDKELLEQPFILSVARLFEYKNHLQMIDIYAQLKQKGIKEKLYIIGEGHEHIYHTLVEKIKNLGLEKDCLLLGSRKNPFPFMKRAKLFIHTSILEGLPTVFIESMACGTPVVAFDCPTGPKEILGNGQFGALIPFKDEQAFVETTYQLLRDNQALDLYRNKLEQAIAPFQMNTIRAQFFALLKQQGKQNA